MNTTSRLTPAAGFDSSSRPPQDEFPTLAGYLAGADTRVSAAAPPSSCVAPLGYSELPDDDALGTEFGYQELPDPDAGEAATVRETLPQVIIVVVSILAVGAIALVIALAVGIRLTGDQLPSSGTATNVPNGQTAVPAAPEVQQPNPSPSGTDIVQELAPVYQQAPQTVYLTPRPAPQAPPAVVAPPEAAVPAPPQENEKPPVDPEPAPEEDETAEPAPEENTEPEQQDNAGSAGDTDREADPGAGGPAGMDPFSVLDRVPEDPRLSLGGPPIILDPTPPPLPSE